MENLLLIGLCFIAGILLRRQKLVGDKGPESLNAIIIYVSLPAVALNYAHGLELSPELLLPAAMGLIVFALGCAMAWAAGKAFHFPPKTVACLCLTVGLGNTAFFGLPMVEAYFGAEYLGMAVLCDQGTFLALAVPAVILAARASGQSVRTRDLIRKVVLFPPFIAMAAGLALKPLPYAPWFASLLAKLGATLTPLALLSVGLNLKFGSLRGNGLKLAVGMGCKLMLIPAAIAFLYAGVLGLSGPAIQIAVFDAAMPPMVIGGVLAALYGLDEDFAALMVGAGIPLAFVTLPFWYWVMASG